MLGEKLEHDHGHLSVFQKSKLFHTFYYFERHLDPYKPHREGIIALQIHIDSKNVHHLKQHIPLKVWKIY